MGVLPDQPGGTSLDFGLLTDLFAVTADGEIPSLADRDQPAIEDTLKQREIKESPGWLGAHEAGFFGLIPGVPLVANVLMTLVNSITGLPLGTWPGSGPFGFLGEIPNIIADVGNFFFNLTGFFGDIDFNDLLFDIPTAIFNFVDTMLLPTDLIASLIGGFIPGFQIPGLDASKIVSGSFPMAMIDGLLDALSETVQGLVDEFFGVAGLPISLFTDFLKLPGGFFPALVPNGDGTAAPTQLANIIDNLDGTALISAGVGTVLQVVDNTVSTLENALSGFLGLFGVHQGTLNAVANGLQGGTTTSAASVNDVQIAAQNAADALADNTSQILALQQSASPGTVKEVVDFTSRPNSSSLSGMNFNQFYSGPGSHPLGVYSGRGTWDSSSGPFPDQYRHCVAIKNDVETTGDDQLIGVAYSTKPETKTNDYIFGRANLTGTTYILAEFTTGRLQLSCVVSGVQTIFTSTPFSKKSSAAYYLKCGPGRQFTVYENTNQIMSYTEPGTTSAMGAGFRRGGWGGKANTTVFYWAPIFLRPGKATAFSIADA